MNERIDDSSPAPCLLEELRMLREAVRFAAKEWSSCSHYGGCLPGGHHPSPKKEWCAHCRILHAANAPDQAQLQPTPEAGCSAIDRSVCYNATCHAPKRNCCAAYLGCEGFETVVHLPAEPKAKGREP